MSADSRDDLTQALLAIAEGDYATALSLCRRARVTNPSGHLASALAAYLAADLDTAGGVYVDPSAFEEFIDRGDNPNLYRATIEAIQASAESPDSLIDVGCGDGRVTRQTIGEGTKTIHLVEPSAAMLGVAVDAVVATVPNAAVSATNAGIETLIKADDGDRWTRAQSTFALHTIPFADRPSVLRWLADHVDSIALVEFDVPAFDDRSQDHARYAVERYERGLREYGPDSAAVSGFLMPVLVGQFDPEIARHTWEQPIERWKDDLRGAGFQDVRSKPVHDYWWATAHIVTGHAVTGRSSSQALSSGSA